MPDEISAFDSVQVHWVGTAQSRWGKYISALERRALLAAHSTFRQPGVGFEIGCGGGRWIRLLSDLGWDMTATDISSNSLSLCQSRNPAARCLLVSEDDKQFPIPSASVDLVVCIEVPRVDCSPFAAEVARVLKPGGKLVGCQPNALSWRGAAVTIKSAVQRSKRHYFIAFASLRKSLRANGFSVDYACGCCWPPFGRHSNSRLIPVATAIERMLGLRRLASISPWVVYSATLGMGGRRASQRPFIEPGAENPLGWASILA